MSSVRSLLLLTMAFAGNRAVAGECGNDGFGDSVAMWQNSALIGADGRNSATGAVFYFTMP